MTYFIFFPTTVLLCVVTALHNGLQSKESRGAQCSGEQHQLQHPEADTAE